MSAAIQKFGFDTVFGASGDITRAAPRPRRLFPAEEVEQIRIAAQAEGERIALASVASRQAEALARIADACVRALPRLAEVAHEHRLGAAGLALACGRGIADAALERFPTAPVEAALAALAREIDAQPRLVITAEPDLAAALAATLEETARGLGFEGALVIRADEAIGRCAFTLDFGDGQAAFDPGEAARRVTEALEAALAAEGLHAEPLIPGSET
jgi:flagellar assembly protein FliH